MNLLYIEQGNICPYCNYIYKESIFICVCGKLLIPFSEMSSDSFLCDYNQEKIQVCIRKTQGSVSFLEPLYFINSTEWYDLQNKAEKLNIRLKEYIEGLNIKRLISKELRYKILKEQKWRCNNCNMILTMSKNSSWQGEIANIDHIHPFADRYNYPKGSKYINERENLQGLCVKCNKSKSKNKN